MISALVGHSTSKWVYSKSMNSACPACCSEVEIPLFGVEAKCRSRYRGPVECLPRGMRSLFNWGVAYSSGVGGTIVLGPAPQRPVKFMAMRSEAHLTGVAPADGTGACPVAPADGTGARDIIINSQ